MEPACQTSPERSFVLRTYTLYAGLIARAPLRTGPMPESRDEPGLGGQLVYVGELDDDGRALVAASNIAGSASLSATANPQAQRDAMREGVIDFQVTSLDEALRILKNEVRKKEAVSVCVSQAPERVEAEMADRGVKPDIWRKELSLVENSFRPAEPVLVQWSVPNAPALWMPRLDAIAAECLAPSAPKARRWLRLFPRYVGRSARGVRLLRSTAALAACFVHHVQTSLDAGELGGMVQISVTGPEGTRDSQFTPKLQPR